jgi:hypothetical protein
VIGEVDEVVRTHTTTKHPACAMSLGFVASNGLLPPLIWFPVGFQLNAAKYIDILETKFLPWVHRTFLGKNVVLQQDGAPAHTANTTQAFLSQKIDFWLKTMWPPYSPDVNPLDYAFWPHVPVQGLPPPQVSLFLPKGAKVLSKLEIDTKGR